MQPIVLVFGVHTGQRIWPNQVPAIVLKCVYHKPVSVQPFPPSSQYAWHGYPHCSGDFPFRRDTKLEI